MGRMPVGTGELLEAAADVAWRFRAYGSYGGEPATAIRALHKKCPAHSPVEYSEAFATGVELYDFVKDLVGQRASALWKTHDSGDDTWPRSLDAEIRKQFPGVPVSAIHGLVGMMFYYWHLGSLLATIPLIQCSYPG